MLSSQMFLTFVVLVAAVAGPVPDRPPPGSNSQGTFPSRRRWYDYNKLPRPCRRKQYYENVLEQCWVEATADNYRVVIDVNHNSKENVDVVLKNYLMFVVKTTYESYLHAIQQNGVLSKSTFTEVRAIPPNSVVASAVAVVTCDGYLVIDIPLDAQVKPDPQERVVPVEESGKPLEGGRPSRGERLPAEILELEPELQTYIIHTMLNRAAKHFKVKDDVVITADYCRYIVKPINASDITKDDLNVVLRDGFVLTYSELHPQEAGGFKNVVIGSHVLPPNSDVAYATATLSSDGYLVVDVPIDADAEPAPRTIKLPVTESGMPLMVEKIDTTAGAATITDSDNYDTTADTETADNDRDNYDTTADTETADNDRDNYDTTADTETADNDRDNYGTTTVDNDSKR